MSWISGAFSATYNAKALGSVEDGFEQITTPIYEEIRPDHYRGVVNGIFQGIDMMIRAVFIEINFPGVRDLIWPWDGDNDGTLLEAADLGNVARVGMLLSALAKPLVLTPCPGTTAATLGNMTTSGGGALASITYPRAIIAAEASSIKRALTLHKIPVTILILPDETVTAPEATTLCGPKSYYVLA